MVELLEDHGIKVGLVNGHDEFDACTIWANQTIPVIVIKRDIAGDRQRFNLAHELGHMVLEPNRELDEEKAAYRFAGAFLVPEPKVRFELGAHRDILNLYELHLLKHKYGLSMQGWIYRARDLGVLSESTVRRLFVQFRREGWHRKEPGDQLPPEEPRRMQRLVLRALAEDLTFLSQLVAALRLLRRQLALAGSTQPLVLPVRPVLLFERPTLSVGQLARLEARGNACASVTRVPCGEMASCRTPRGNYARGSSATVAPHGKSYPDGPTSRSVRGKFCSLSSF